MMEKKRAETGKNILKNVLYGFSTWILPIGLGFFATPILVKSLGDEDYGIYALVLGFIAYSFNFSIGRAITKYISEYRSTGENEKIRDVISATFFLNLTIGLAGVLVIFLSARWFVVDVFRIEEVSRQKSIYSFYLASLIIFLTMLSQVFNAVLQGIHRFDVYSKIFNFNTLALMIGNIWLALRGHGLLSLLVWNLSVSLLTCLFYFFGARRLLPEFGLRFSFPREALKKVLKFSSGVIGYQILANFLLLFERGWITRKLGSGVLTHYVVPMMLSLYIHGFISSLMIVIFPLASELNENRERLLSLYLKATKIVCLIVAFLGMTLIVQSRVFLTLWMGTDFAERSSEILIFHTVTFSLLAVLTVSWQMTEGLGFPEYNFKIFSVCLFLTVVFTLVLTAPYGGIGVAAARLIGFATIFFSIFYVEKWFFGKIQYRAWGRIIFILGVATGFAALIEIVIIRLGEGWPVFFGSVLAGGIVYILTAFLLGFVSKEELALAKHIFKRQT
ncbi:MAG: oligosaccharide flippase family protein [Pyrinomonadaceae bacterium]